MARTPSFEYSLHKASGQAYVRIGGKVRYLGRYGTHESRVRHQNIVAAAQARREAIDLMRPLSVGELAERYLAAMRAEYGPKSWQAVEGRRIALAVCERFAGLEAAAFGPKSMQEVQQSLLRRGRICRTGVNRMVRRTAAMFKWAVSEELLPPTVWQALQSVRPLRRGKGREVAPRMAVPSVAVDAVVAHLEGNGAFGAAWCLRFMRATGCRPGEAYSATPADFRLSDDPPVYIPQHHKCESRGMDRIIVLNSAAVAVVREALRECGQTHGPLFRNTVGKGWEVTTMAHMIERACEALKIERWTPYQLRHLAATEAVNRTGSEAAAAALLGHSPDSTMIRRYSRNRLLLAAQAARAVGA
jgi:integrase